MARISLQRLAESDIHKYPSLALVDYYDIIHKLMEAFSLRNGVKTKGEGAHRELIENVAKEMPLTEKNRIFLQNLRDIRNRISYEGYSVDENFFEIHEKNIREIITLFSIDTV